MLGERSPIGGDVFSILNRVEKDQEADSEMNFDLSHYLRKKYIILIFVSLYKICISLSKIMYIAYRII